MVYLFRAIRNIALSIFETLFPSTCNVCGVRLCGNDMYLCNSCMSSFPETNNWFDWNNALKVQLDSIAKVKGAVAFLYYSPNDNYGNIIINLKFRNQRKLAYFMGRLFAMHLLNSPITRDTDFIIPVPLHSSRKRWRGYNQSDYIAAGMAEVLQIPMLDGAVRRVKRGSVQSSIDSSAKRLLNMKDSFMITDKSIFRNKKILLVDDVITTGATIANCVDAINKSISSCDIIVASLYYRDNIRIKN